MSLNAILSLGKTFPAPPLLCCLLDKLWQMRLSVTVFSVCDLADLETDNGSSISVELSTAYTSPCMMVHGTSANMSRPYANVMLLVIPRQCLQTWHR